MNGNPYYIEPFAGLLPSVGQSIAQGINKYQANELNKQAASMYEKATPEELNAFALRNPEVGRNVLAMVGIREKQQVDDLVNHGKAILANPDNAEQILMDRIQTIVKRGGNPSHTIAELELYRQDPSKLVENTEKSLALAMGKDFAPYYKVAHPESDAEGKEQKTGAFYVKDAAGKVAIAVGSYNPSTGKLRTEMGELPEGYTVVSSVGETPEEKRASDVKSGLAKKEGELKLESKYEPDIAGKKKESELKQELDYKPIIESKTEAAKGTTQAATTAIEKGVTSAEQLPIITNTLNLLESIKTGGLDGARIKAKEMFGIEAADEGELSYNLGVNVLKQLKPTFGAQFTVAEGKELKKIEAGLGKNTETNKRLLKQLYKISKRGAERARRLAKDRGDNETVDYLSSFLQPEKGELIGKAKPVTGSKQMPNIPPPAKTVSSQADYDALPAGTPYIYDGKPYVKGQ